MRSYASILIFCVALLIAFCTSVSAQKKSALTHGQISLTTQEIAHRAIPCVARLTVRDAQGQIVSSGSGFVAGKDLIATNAHVIRDAGSVTVNFLNGRSEKAFGVVALDNDHDLALLYANTTGIPCLLFADVTHAHIGDPVVAVGSPEGLDGSISTGIVSAIRLSGSARLIQTNAAISHGSSGGPLLNDQAQVLGVTSFMVSEGQNLNFAYSSFYVKQLIPAFITRFQHFGSTEWSGVTDKDGSVGQLATVLKDNSPIQADKSHHGKILAFVSRGQNLSVLGEDNQFYVVLMIDKSLGYVTKKNVRLLPYRVMADSTVQTLGERIAKLTSTYLSSTQGRDRTIDSAQLIKSVFAQLKLDMPDAPEKQAAIGYDVPHDVPAGEWRQWVRGDRLYFACTHPFIDDTGIYIGEGLFIHVASSGKVKCERIDDDFYSAHLVAVRRSAELLSEPSVP